MVKLDITGPREGLVPGSSPGRSTKFMKKCWECNSSHDEWGDYCYNCVMKGPEPGECAECGKSWYFCTCNAGDYEPTMDLN